MRTSWAMTAGCALLCALSAACSKSREPIATGGAARAGAGEADSGANAAAGAGGDAGTDGGASANAGSNGAAGAESNAAGAAAEAGSTAVAGGTGGTEPATETCSTPWYQCRDACPGTLILEGATRSFGECAGDCTFTLELRPAIVLEDGTCASLLATLTVQNTDGSRRIYNGTVTAAAWEQATLLSIDVEAARAAIPAVSGCPDCADGGASTIVIRGLDQLTQTFGYEYGNPPAALRAADAFTQALIDELLACEGRLLESCSHSDIDPDMEPESPACTFVYSSMTSAVACAMPLDADRPCAVAADCLCQSGILAGPPAQNDGCVASWLTARGAITFTDVCTQGQTDLTRTLASALASFANAYGDTVTTTPECDVVNAYY